MQRDQALNKHELKEHSRKLEFEVNAKKQFEKKVQELQAKLDLDSDMREESTKLQRKVQSLEKEVKFFLLIVIFLLLNFFFPTKSNVILLLFS